MKNFEFRRNDEYSKEKFEKAENQDLGPERMQLLHKFRDLKKRWEEKAGIFGGTEDGAGMMEFLLNEWKIFREAMRPAQIQYHNFKGKEQHKKLEKEYSKTKSGQLEIAEQEANLFNDAFDIRKERLDKALKDRENGPNGQKEYESALTSFNELVKDLNEGNLENYMSHIDLLREDHGFDKEKYDLKSDA